MVARSPEGTCGSTQGTKERALAQHEDSWLAILGLPSSAGWLYANHLPLLEPEHPICDCLLSSQDGSDTHVGQSLECLVALRPKKTGFVLQCGTDGPFLVLFDKMGLCPFVQMRIRRPRGADVLGQLLIIVVFFLGFGHMGWDSHPGPGTC